MDKGKKRMSNNDSVKKSRAKKKKEEDERKIKKQALEVENSAIETNIESLKQDITFVSKIVNAHVDAEGGSKDLVELKNLVKNAQNVADQDEPGSSKERTGRETKSS